MTYATDTHAPTGCALPPWPDPSPTDLDAILTTLELAAIELTPTAGATFTHDEVIRRSREIDPRMTAGDLARVLRGSNFLRRESGGRWSLR